MTWFALMFAFSSLALIRELFRVQSRRLCFITDELGDIWYNKENGQWKFCRVLADTFLFIDIKRFVARMRLT